MTLFGYLGSLFCAIFQIWKQHLPLKCSFSEVFIPDVCVNCVHVNISNFVHTWTWNYFFQQIVAGLSQNLTGKERLSKRFKLLLLQKKSWIFSKLLHDEIFFPRRRLYWFFLLKLSLHPIFEVFCRNQKKEKLENLKKLIKKEIFPKKKLFQPSESHLSQCWRAEKFPEAARTPIRIQLAWTIFDFKVSNDRVRGVVKFMNASSDIIRLIDTEPSQKFFNAQKIEKKNVSI